MPLWRAHRLDPPPFAGCYEHLYLDVYPPGLDPGGRAHVRATQHLRPGAFATGGDEPLPSLVTAPGGPLVYVTFGTMFADDTGLAAVVEAVRVLDVRVVVTVGPLGDPTALGPQPGNVAVARYVAQDRLLPHAAVVVSHAGSGTFLAALAAGLPQLCLPRAADQFLNAAACTRSGAGLVIEPGPVPVDTVRHAVERLLTDPSFRAAAGRVSDEIGAMPSPVDVAELLRSTYG